MESLGKVLGALLLAAITWVVTFVLSVLVVGGVVTLITGKGTITGLPAFLIVLGWWVPPIVVFVGMSGIWEALISAWQQRRADAEARIKAARNAEEAKIRALRAAEERKRHQAMELELAQQRFAEEQRQLKRRAAELLSNSMDLIGELPVIAQQAQDALDNAEQEFTEGVFAPFWDAIEGAANYLARFNQNVNQVVANRNEHGLLVPKIEQERPKFALAIDTLPDATYIAERMRMVVRKAQKQPDFAKIYEMRQHNKLLAAGFSSLSHAIGTLQWSLKSSIDDLKSTVVEEISELASEQRKTASETHKNREQAMLIAMAAARSASEAEESAAEDRRKERELLEEIRDQTKRP